MRYLINSWKLLSENRQPPEKLHSPLKIQKMTKWSPDHFWSLNSKSFWSFSKNYNCYKPFRDVIIISFSAFSWNHKTWGKKEENFKNLNTWSKRAFYVKQKAFFITFERFFLGRIWNNKRNPFFFLSTIWLPHI